MNKEDYAAYWAGYRAKMEADGWVITKFRSTDPAWSPDNPGDHMHGDWQWSFRPQEKAIQAQPTRNIQKKRIDITASATF